MIQRCGKSTTDANRCIKLNPFIARSHILRGNADLTLIITRYAFPPIAVGTSDMYMDKVSAQSTVRVVTFLYLNYNGGPCKFEFIKMSLYA